jgi:predicted ATP-grasp superfamily ATP-dependent carboligase
MQILLVGASVRALAESATRAGHDVIAADIFGDEDLRAVCPACEVVPIDDYPAGLLPFIRRHPDIPRCYTGGLENDPALLRALEQSGPLWGNTAQVCSLIRDPFRWQTWLIDHQFQTPATRSADQLLSDPTRWLIKPRRGTGGTRVQFAHCRPPQSDDFYQEFVPGQAYSALFVGSPVGTLFLGVTRQILRQDLTVGPEETKPFAYAGSLGPLPNDQDRDNKLRQLGNACASELGLRGVFGIDFIWNEKQIWVIEINPRYTASSELFELAMGVSVFERHRQAFDHASIDLTEPPSAIRMMGKWIYYAPCPARLDRPLPTWDETGGSYGCADRPAVGTYFQTNEPVFTLIQSAADTQPNHQDRLSQLWRDHFTPVDQP